MLMTALADRDRTLRPCPRLVRARAQCSSERGPDDRTAEPPLGDLNHRDATELVRSRVAEHHRTIPHAVAARLVSRSMSPRWLVVATDLILTLMAYDYLSLREALMCAWILKSRCA